LVTSLVTLSTGEQVSNPRYEQRDRVRLARAQRRLARKVKGSANRAKARVEVARIHARIADRRRDHLHKLSTRIIRENQTVVSRTCRSGTWSATSLARAISDASWSELRRQLEYKADWYGRTVVAVDRFYPSSKTCSACGRINSGMPLNVRSWTCLCGSTHDRDVNAARNILAAGLAASACGDGVRPART
jgi:putative transposase